ncbi:MAG: hypothetical protein S0880_18510 [Actinomycetota bacterium]|nr:hypothetical protein [Actinomycetota bacterium]
MRLALVVVGVGLLAVALWLLPLGAVVALLLPVIVVSTLQARERNREAMRATPPDMRRVGDDDREPGDAFQRASGLHSWMRGGRN